MLLAIDFLDILPLGHGTLVTTEMMFGKLVHMLVGGRSPHLDHI
jgi:hypothetical protein